MTRFTLTTALLLLLAGSAYAAEPKPESFDILCLTDTRPVVVRLTVATDGKPLAAAWAGFADALFAHLDADSSGTLEGKEPARLPQTLTLLTRRQNFPAPPAKMTRADLGEYLRKNDLGPFRLPTSNANSQPRVRFARGGTGNQSEALDKVLMELLDTDKDGKLSTAELAAAPALLAKLDADENELVTTDELLGRAGPSPYFFEEGVRPRATAPRFEMVLLNRKGADPALAKRLLDRYAPQPKENAARPKRLTKADLKLSAEAFAALDQDGDDELDAEELSRFATACVPEVELAFHIGKMPEGKRAAEVVAGGKAPVSAVARGDQVALELPGMRVDFAPASTTAVIDLRNYYLSIFRQLDRDANGYLDETEAANGPFSALFTLLDADGDGKVFEKELVAALDAVKPLSEASRALVTADAVDAGRGLFGLIDTDGDGQISIRERLAIPKLAERFGTDGFVGPDAAPRRFQVALVGGLVPTRAVFGRPDGAVERPPAGPAWFRKMDRNRDGFVSRREFLGTDEDFRRLDLDGDGLIDAREAEAGERK